MSFPSTSTDVSMVTGSEAWHLLTQTDSRVISKTFADISAHQSKAELDFFSASAYFV